MGSLEGIGPKAIELVENAESNLKMNFQKMIFPLKKLKEISSTNKITVVLEVVASFVRASIQWFHYFQPSVVLVP